MNFLFFAILFPFLGFFILSVFQRLLPRNIISVVGVGSIGLSVLTATFVMFDFLNHIHAGNNSFFFVQPIFVWVSFTDFFVPVVLRLDGLSLSMLLLITWVSFFIHIYSSWYMFNNDDASYSIFFAYMNLFVANMIVLILADNLIFLYFGWEGVGLCSYLLIGFYYDNVKNGQSALKSFIMTRIGDVFLICAIFMLYNCFHTLDLHKLVVLPFSASNCNISLNLIALFLCVAAVAKSAQCPFHTWLSDAMVAPTPVSALIHAATMVTAGVYLIARTYNIFIMAPDILYLVGVIGSITLVISSCSALVQTDVKRILAYSTMGQISYMFIALAVQSWESAIFHLIVHAFFKALLFLASGSLILIASGEQNIFKIAKVYKSAPLIYFSFLVGGASLSAIPIVTSGFYSKGEILWNVLLSGNCLFTIAGLCGSFLTSLYTFRMIFIIFHTEPNKVISKSFYNFSHYISLLILLILSTFIGALLKMPMFGALPPLSIYDHLEGNYFFYDKLIFEISLSIIVISGCCLSFMYYVFSYSTLFNKLLNCRIGDVVLRCCLIGWGFDLIYKKIFIKPYLWISRIVFCDPVNCLSYCITYMVNFFSDSLILTANGQLRYYIQSMLFGITVILLILIFI